jgi:glycosyltransferase involved in cell wall biosynthesis
MEDFYIPRFDSVYVCSAGDRSELTRRFPQAGIHVVPNVIRLSAEEECAHAPGVFTFLFVGSLDYFPNEDAALFFCLEVLPLLRPAAPPFRVVIAGANPKPRVKALAELENVEIVANPRSIADLYRDADAAVIPLRAGGGTRIKLLEAASYRLPIITTRLGAEGLTVTHGREVLFADDAAGFVRQALTLMSDAKYRERLAAQSFAWVETNHTVERLRKESMFPEMFQMTEGGR